MNKTKKFSPEVRERAVRMVPVARGGVDKEENWVTTSMLRTQAKSNWTLEELGRSLHEPGSLEEWDGLSGWFSDCVAQNPEVLCSSYLKRWHNSLEALGNQQGLLDWAARMQFKGNIF
jgi:hypothetical protein